MISLMEPADALAQLAVNVRARRLSLGFTQAGLAARSGVALATLRKFERTGMASIETLMRLLAIVGGMEAVVAATRAPAPEFRSIDDVLETAAPARRKNGWRS